MLRPAPVLMATHGVAALCGFALGIYLLPILTAPPAPDATELAAAVSVPQFTGQFRRDLPGSDLFHWGDGKVSLSHRAVVLQGRLAPGPDYRLYLSPVYVDTKADFLQHKQRMVQIGDVKTFENFIVPVPAGTSLAAHNTVIVWCESFSQFITAARYR